MQNPYIPIPVDVDKIVTEVTTKDIKTFRFTFVNKEDEDNFKYLPGQFSDLSYNKPASKLAGNKVIPSTA